MLAWACWCRSDGRLDEYCCSASTWCLLVCVNSLNDSNHSVSKCRTFCIAICIFFRCCTAHRYRPTSMPLRGTLVAGSLDC